ncbi:ornithine carbamoyltransferase [Pedosphaera parvula]|uniref:Ornithine carbamoyltransferase n=1 Tax=Pedosphaera parvula (strain Ellin514) TaxID=320771 RepID=B9XQ49_PEDPL|nr:ornithine carbamoyltransferase [Pedosphaera parvula]EEF58053.1 ornithine carbamoyltransferase [Pedosphaera parvula Ellin514]
MKHLLSIESLAKADMDQILAASGPIKKERGHHKKQPLGGQTWAMIFTKSSTRTRVSFEVGVRELGGQVMFLNANDIQLGRGEPIKDTARVLGRMVHGAIIRTFAQKDVEDFAHYSRIPTINALTDDEHPCQILTDIFTFQEKRGPIQGKVVTWIGDGSNNMAYSWIFAAAKLGFEFRIAAPREYQPAPEILSRAGGKIVVTDDVKAAAHGADMLYTDVWISMGQEAQAAERIKKMAGYQINAASVKLAKPDALVMHCLPAYRGKEIDEATFEAHAQTIFDQAENRLHVQKAILDWAVS